MGHQCAKKRMRRVEAYRIVLHEERVTGAIGEGDVDVTVASVCIDSGTEVGLRLTHSFQDLRAKRERERAER